MQRKNAFLACRAFKGTSRRTQPRHLILPAMASAAVLDAARALERIVVNQLGLAVEFDAAALPDLAIPPGLDLPRHTAAFCGTTLDAVEDALVPHANDASVAPRVALLLAGVAHLRRILGSYNVVAGVPYRGAAGAKGGRSGTGISNASTPAASSGAPPRIDPHALLYPHEELGSPDTRPLLPHSLALKRSIDAVSARLEEEAARAGSSVFGVQQGRGGGEGEGEASSGEGGPPAGPALRTTSSLPASRQGSGSDARAALLGGRRTATAPGEDADGGSAATREALLADMEHMTGELRQAAHHVLEQLQADNAALDGIGEGMEANVAATQAANARLKSESWGALLSLCSTFTTLTFGVLVFFVAYMAIKIVPYRHWDSPPAQQPEAPEAYEATTTLPQVLSEGVAAFFNGGGSGSQEL